MEESCPILKLFILEIIKADFFKELEKAYTYTLGSYNAENLMNKINVHMNWIGSSHLS